MVTLKCPIQECFTLTLPGPTSRVHCANNETSRFSNIQREGEQAKGRGQSATIVQ